MTNEVEDAMVQERCCFKYMDLNKGIMFIGIITLLEFCICFSNYSEAWFVMFLKVIVLCLFICSFKHFENAKLRKYLFRIYGLFAVLEAIVIIIWCTTVIDSDEYEERCTKLSNYERGKAEMEKLGMNSEEYVAECIYSK